MEMLGRCDKSIASDINTNRRCTQRLCSDRINGDDIKLEDFKDDIDEKRNNCAPRIGNIKFGNDIIPLTMIKHTSQGYSYDEWKKYLRIRDSQMMDYLCTYQRK